MQGIKVGIAKSNEWTGIKRGDELERTGGRGGEGCVTRTTNLRPTLIRMGSPLSGSPTQLCSKVYTYIDDGKRPRDAQTLTAF